MVKHELDELAIYMIGDLTFQTACQTWMHILYSGFFFEALMFHEWTLKFSFTKN